MGLVYSRDRAGSNEGQGPGSQGLPDGKMLVHSSRDGRVVERVSTVPSYRRLIPTG